MQHVKDVDQKHSTVIMVQVENEVGLLGDSRDGSKAANTAFSQDVPEDLTSKLEQNWDHLHPNLKRHLQGSKLRSHHRSGNWEKTFGRSAHTDEIFMA